MSLAISSLAWWSRSLCVPPSDPMRCPNLVSLSSRPRASTVLDHLLPHGGCCIHRAPCHPDAAERLCLRCHLPENGAIALILSLTEDIFHEYTCDLRRLSPFKRRGVCTPHENAISIVSLSASKCVFAVSLHRPVSDACLLSESHGRLNGPSPPPPHTHSFLISELRRFAHAGSLSSSISPFYSFLSLFLGVMSTSRHPGGPKSKRLFGLLPRQLRKKQ